MKIQVTVSIQYLLLTLVLSIHPTFAQELAPTQWQLVDVVGSPNPRHEASFVSINDSAYLIGGRRLQPVDKFDFEAKQWIEMPKPPIEIHHFQAVVVANKLYAIAGRLSSEATQQPFERTLGTIDVFDFETQRWSSLPQELNLPTQRAGNMAISIGDNIVIAGGESGSQVLAHNEVEVFNTKNLNWLRWPDMQQNRHGTGIIEHLGRIYLASGCLNRGGEPELKSIEFLELAPF